MQAINHKANFLEFSKLHFDTGCPDPHLKIAVWNMDRAKSNSQKAWIAGCYVAPYEVCTGSLIWANWTPESVIAYPEEFKNFIKGIWPKMNIRRERRAARTPDKMAASIISYAKFVEEVLPEIRFNSYESVWKTADESLLYFGRYALIKVLETLYRGKVLTSPIPDIRPVGGWSPREVLAQLYPEHQERILKGNKPSNLLLIKGCTDHLQVELSTYIGTWIDYYNIEVLLCNYRQYPKHHPGWPLDSDLAYFRKFENNWNHGPYFDWKQARKELFPPEVLGEVQGWDGPRDAIENTFPLFGYHWSDLIYDFRATQHPKDPVRR